MWNLKGGSLNTQCLLLVASNPAFIIKLTFTDVVISPAPSTECRRSSMGLRGCPVRELLGQFSVAQCYVRNWKKMCWLRSGQLVCQWEDQNLKRSWTRCYKYIFSVDLRYAGVLALRLAKNGHLTFISQKECSKISVAYIYAKNIYIKSVPTGLIKRN